MNLTLRICRTLDRERPPDVRSRPPAGRPPSALSRARGNRIAVVESAQGDGIAGFGPLGEGNYKRLRQTGSGNAYPGSTGDPPVDPRGRDTHPTSKSRFRDNDRYRAGREWARYEGTAQRDLFFELRARFIRRHLPARGWAIEIGGGPGRMAAELAKPHGTRLAVLDIGRSMLELLADRWPSGPGSPVPPDRIRGDAVRPPLTPGRFELVSAMGNILGFSGEEASRLFDRVMELVAPAGIVLIEIAPGSGERSRYLRRLPEGATARALRVPIALVTTRVRREGFEAVPARRRRAGEFRRFAPTELAPRLESAGFVPDEIVAVAPALGAEPARLARIARDPKAWDHLIELEEILGREPQRWPGAAAVLIAAHREAGGEAVRPASSPTVPPKRES